MYSKATQHKASKGSVQIKSSNNRLQLVFSYDGKRHYLSLGLPDNKLTRKTAEFKAKQIEEDIFKDMFDSTLTRYKPQSALSTVTPTFTPISTPSLAELWEKFLEYKRPQCSPSTMRYQYRVFSRYLEKLPTHDLEQATGIRDHCLKKIPPNSCKRFITRLSACCDWATQSGLIAQNPFKGMASEIKLPKATKGDGMNDIDPFSSDERDAILSAFLNNIACSKYSRVKHSYYFGYVHFLFHTGCRPSEAIALQWKHVSTDLKFIMFEQAVVEGEDGQVCKEGLKTQEKRRFPCNRRLQEFLHSIKPDDAIPDSLVFPSSTSKWIDSGNFRNRVWKPVLDKLGVQYRKPYQCRHTFITLALQNGLTVQDVARLVGNSPEVIYRHYAGNRRDLFVPEF